MEVLVDSTATFEVVTDSDSIASSLNTDLNIVDYFHFKSSRRAHTVQYTKHGEIA